MKNFLALAVFAFVTLTRPDGGRVNVAVSAIETITLSVQCAGKTRILTSGGPTCVQETPELILDMILGTAAGMRGS